MKIILALLLLLSSSSSFSFVSYESKWIPNKPYVFKAEDRYILHVAKNWASSNYDSKSKYDFKYSVKKLDAGFRLQLTPLFIDTNSKYLYAIDGEMCLDFDEKRTLIQFFQCAFPPYEALKREGY